MRATVTVPGMHHWPGAPDQFAPLRCPHRHLFTFELEVDVTNLDRQVEFLDAGRQMRDALTAWFSRGPWDTYNFEDRSCEMLAEWMLARFTGARRCVVWEDHENAGGAERSDA